MYQPHHHHFFSWKGLDRAVHVTELVIFPGQEQTFLMRYPNDFIVPTCSLKVAFSGPFPLTLL